jgi:hypothetical protein
MVTLGLEELPEEAFAAAVGIRVGGVEKVPPGRQERVEDPLRLVLTGTPAPVFPKRQGASTALRYT